MQLKDFNGNIRNYVKTNSTGDRDGYHTVYAKINGTTYRVTLDEPFFNVSGVSTNNEVVEGDSFSVSGTIDNIDGRELTQTIEYTIDGTVESSTTETIEDESRDISFTDTINSPGSYTLGIQSEDGSDTTVLDVLEEAYYDVYSFSAPSSVDVGEHFSFSAYVKNTGEASDNQYLDYNNGGGNWESLDGGSGTRTYFNDSFNSSGNKYLKISSDDSYDYEYVTVEDPVPDYGDRCYTLTPDDPCKIRQFDINNFDASSVVGTTADGSFTIDPYTSYAYFTPTGDKLITMEDDIFEYSLSTNFDITTASKTATQSVDHYSKNSIKITDGGSKLHYLHFTGDYDIVRQYTLSNNYEITSLSYDGEYYTGGAGSITFSADGSTMYIFSPDITAVDLNNPFDVTNTSNSSESASSSVIGMGGDRVTHAYWANNGSNLYLRSFTGEICKYSCSTDYNATTISKESQVYDGSGDKIGILFNGNPF